MRKFLLAVLLVGATAEANVWQHAIERAAPDDKADLYEAAMRRGDEAADQALSRSISPANLRKLIAAAAKAYREAAAAKPETGEPWYRLGQLDYMFFFDCTRNMIHPWISPLCGSMDRHHGEELVEAWNELEKRAPLDPRVSTILGDSHVLFERAIVHTKLFEGADPKHAREQLEAAAHDYETLLARSSSSSNDDGRETSLANLAETYMMLDRLDDAVDTYREALRHGADFTTTYGLAVALDRDERTAEAIDVIRRAGPNAAMEFKQRVIENITFFVPTGEVYYYDALIAEAFDQPQEAILRWRAYISSGAHPEFQPRAKAHLSALLAKHPKPLREAPSDLDLEVYP